MTTRTKPTTLEVHDALGVWMLTVVTQPDVIARLGKRAWTALPHGHDPAVLIGRMRGAVAGPSIADMKYQMARDLMKMATILKSFDLDKESAAFYRMAREIFDSITPSDRVPSPDPEQDPSAPVHEFDPEDLEPGQEVAKLELGASTSDDGTGNGNGSGGNASGNGSGGNGDGGGTGGGNGDGTGGGNDDGTGGGNGDGGTGDAMTADGGGDDRNTGGHQFSPKTGHGVTDYGAVLGLLGHAARPTGRRDGGDPVASSREGATPLGASRSAAIVIAWKSGPIDPDPEAAPSRVNGGPAPGVTRRDIGFRDPLPEATARLFARASARDLSGAATRGLIADGRSRR